MLILFIGDILPKIYANRNPLVFSKIEFILDINLSPFSLGILYLYI
jgi:hypothetical protein